MRRAERDRGAADALGLVLIAPVAIGLAVLVVYLGRQVDSRAQVQSAAESAAQAAALERTPIAARAAAQAVADAMLLDTDTCNAPIVAVDGTAFHPGGVVRVTVTCHVSTRGLELIDAAPTSSGATASATIDEFRGTG